MGLPAGGASFEAVTVSGYKSPSHNDGIRQLGRALGSVGDKESGTSVDLVTTGAKKCEGAPIAWTLRLGRY
jgi:hypothetical protein